MLSMLRDAGEGRWIVGALAGIALAWAAYARWRPVAASPLVLLAPLAGLLAAVGAGGRYERAVFDAATPAWPEQRLLLLWRGMEACVSLPLVGLVGAAPALLVIVGTARVHPVRPRPGPTIALGLALLLAVVMPLHDLERALETGPLALRGVLLAGLGARVVQLVGRDAQGRDRDTQVAVAGAWLLAVTLAEVATVTSAMFVRPANEATPWSQFVKYQARLDLVDALLVIAVCELALAAAPLMWAARDGRRGTAIVLIGVAFMALWMADPRFWLLTRLAWAGGAPPLPSGDP